MIKIWKIWDLKFSELPSGWYSRSNDLGVVMYGFAKNFHVT